MLQLCDPSTRVSVLDYTSTWIQITMVPGLRTIDLLFGLFPNSRTFKNDLTWWLRISANFNKVCRIKGAIVILLQTNATLCSYGIVSANDCVFGYFNVFNAVLIPPGGNSLSVNHYHCSYQYINNLRMRVINEPYHMCGCFSWQISFMHWLSLCLHLGR